MDLDSEPDDNYELVIPKDFPKYISQIKSLIKYADKIIWKPDEKNPVKGLEEMANLGYMLIKTRDSISRYLESNSWDYKAEFNDLFNCIDGRITMLNGQVPNLHLLLTKINKS